MQRIQKTIEEFLTDEPVPAVEPGATVADAVALMERGRRDCVLVTEGGRVRGIFTERDFLNRVAATGKSPARTPVTEVMTPEPQTLRPHDCITYAINRMGVRGFRNIPIVDDRGNLAGMLSVRDVVSHLNEVFAEVEDPGAEEEMGEWIDIGGGG